MTEETRKGATTLPTTPEQLALTDLYPCDVCRNGVETDPETGIFMRCRVCGGTGTLDYDPAGCDSNPFHGLEAA